MVAHSFNLGRGGRDRTTYRDHVSKDKTKTRQNPCRITLCGRLWMEFCPFSSPLLGPALRVWVTGEQTQDLVHGKPMLSPSVFLLICFLPSHSLPIPLFSLSSLSFLFLLPRPLTFSLPCTPPLFVSPCSPYSLGTHHMT